MFVLVDRFGVMARMRSGSPFVYSSRALAEGGKRALQAVPGCVTVWRVREYGKLEVA